MEPVGEKIQELRAADYVMPVRLQLIAIIVTIFCVSMILYRASYRFKPWEVSPQLIMLTPQQLAQFGSSQADVQVGLLLRNFVKFDVVKGEIIADMTVRFTFDSRKLTVDRLKDFTFAHAEILKKSEPRVRLVKDDTIVSYDLRVQFSPDLNYRQFPFDGHRIFITLVPGAIAPAEALFTTRRSDFLLGHSLYTSGWRCIDRHSVVGYSEEKFEQDAGAQRALYPRIQFSLDFARAGIRHIISLVMPFLLIFFIALLGFALNPLDAEVLQNILALSTVSMTALIAYCFVIESMSPQAGYLMISDQLFLLFLALVTIIFFVNIFSDRIKRGPKIAIAYTLHLTLIVTLFFLTW